MPLPFRNRSQANPRRAFLSNAVRHAEHYPGPLFRTPISRNQVGYRGSNSCNFCLADIRRSRCRLAYGRVDYVHCCRKSDNRPEL